MQRDKVSGMGTRRRLPPLHCLSGPKAWLDEPASDALDLVEDDAEMLDS
jgi:hypothetical protein